MSTLDSGSVLEPRLLLIAGIAYYTCAFFVRMVLWKKIRFRNIPGFIFAADLLLWPFMILGATGKITHWWDWAPVPNSEIDPEIQPLILSSRTSQQRVYKETRWLGRYNWGGVTDVYKTLFVLHEVVVLEPESYQGFWRLLVAGNRYQDEKQYDLFDRVDLLVMGAVKTLIDGRKWFLGQTEDGICIPLTLIAQTLRDQYPDIPFV